MIRAQSLERARAGTRRVEKPTFVGHVTDLVVSDDGAAVPSPQSFLVEQTAHWTLPAHFHLRHQFQLFVGGSGSLGRERIAPLTVHYASAHSGYGPLLSEGEGIAYLTLRAMSDTGAWYLPEQRERMRRNARRQQAHAAPAALLDAAALRALAHPRCETLLACDEGGLAAWIVRLPAGAPLAPPAGAERGGGRFYVLTQGELDAGGERLAGLATVYAEPGDAPRLVAGAAGAEVVVLQFPAEALAPPVD